MENKQQITGTDGVLNSLDGLQKASPGAFFFTRVQARLQQQETSSWGKMALFMAKPAVAFATLGLIFLLNAAALFYQHSVPVGADQAEQVNAEDYNTTLAANSYYDDNDAR